MDVHQGKEKIREIIRRSSIRNYFTPMLPKHTEKPKLSKLSKMILKYQEPKKVLMNSPVSIRNYKNISRLTPLGNESMNVLEPRFSRLSTNKLNLSQDCKTPLSKFLSPLRKSTELELLESEAETSDLIRKSDNKSASLKEKAEETHERNKNISLSLTRNERLLKISQIKCIIKQVSLMKTLPRVKDQVKTPKYVSIGEGTDDTSINGWDYPGDSPDLY